MLAPIQLEELEQEKSIISDDIVRLTQVRGTLGAEPTFLHGVIATVRAHEN